ncbi:HEAT repeat domain-containing protein [Micromonospora chersina]|uniref:HEAT repeat domain-containing protein n=1 Tax=Micromonospora chersina TaxID=47854 RepID=UPI00340960BF
MTLDEVFQHVDTLDGDPWPVIEELAASGDYSLVPPVQAALERYLDEHNWYGRDLMAYILAGLRGTAAFPLLLRAFARPLRDDRDNLCAWLADIMQADPAGCRPFVLSFIAAEHRDLRAAGLWALGYLIQPRDIEVLQQALSDADPQIRRAALGSLTSLKSDRSAYELVLSALYDPDDETRQSAVLHLRWFADPDAVNHLLPLTRDTALHVRSALSETIGHLLLGSDHRPDATAALLSLLVDPEPQVRAGAAHGLGNLGGPLDALQDHASDPDQHVRAAIAVALAKNARPSLTTTLQILASDTSAAVRADLATALGGCDWPGVQPLIAALTQDPDRTVRARANVALTRIS